MTTWITRRDEEAVARDLAATALGPVPSGLRLAVKDNIDVAGLPTTAACPAFATTPARSAPVVRRLEAAGAVVVGKANMDQFATGLVGTRSPHGALESPLAPGHVSGGSSSGSAVAVATGEADVALGTDTAGSGRVPAAFCGIVGLKPTRGWLPTTGVVPASRSFDCVSVFARDVATAAATVEAAAGPDADDPWSRTPPPGDAASVRRIGRPSTEVLERWCDPEVVEAFLEADLGVHGQVVEVDLDPYLDAGALLYDGALVAERHAAVGAFVHAHRDEVDPTVGSIIDAAGDLRATDLARDLEELGMLRHRAEATWLSVDAVVVPTAPHHPTLAEVAADPLGTNAALGRFTNGCNLLDWCGAAVPVGTTASGLPFGVTVLGPAWADRSIWVAAAGLAGQDPPDRPSAGAAAVSLAVCGAHLEGQPLHHQLSGRGARLVARTTTAAAYRMVALDTTPPKPGLLRVADGGSALEVEVWALEPAAFGSFVAEVPPPLTIGTVTLADGGTAKGFLCEPHATSGATDISAFGGWRAWVDR